MKITDPGADVVRAAIRGELAGVDAVLVSIQPGVFNLAVRMLGNREDAADSTQEILLKVVTHLGSFRGEAAFTTWVFRIARNHLLTAITRSREFPEVSFESMGARLEAGLAFGASLGDPTGASRSITPEDKLEARQVALGCTQGMLMALNREQRLVYVLDAIFALSSADAADVLGIEPAAFRQRLARVRAVLDPFIQGTCGRVSAAAPCRCERQLPALSRMKAQAAPTGRPQVVPLRAMSRAELAETERHFEALVRLSDAAAVFRAHPEYRAPDAQLGAIRAVLRSEGYWGADGGRSVQ